MSNKLPNFLPGRLWYGMGTRLDYFALEQFHYAAKRPATWAAVGTIRYLDQPASDFSSGRVVAVGVLSFPVPSCHMREMVLDRSTFSRNENLIFANTHIRTISRVVVHPQFRSLGLAGFLVRALCAQCDTRYIESIAAMARAHPFFEKAGMTRIDPKDRDDPVYFILDKSTGKKTVDATAPVKCESAGHDLRGEALASGAE